MKNYALLNGAYTNETMYDFKPVRADHTYLYDQQNRKYFDLRSGLWNVSLGYEEALYERVLNRFQQVLSKNLPYIDSHSFQHDAYDQVAEKVLKLTGAPFKRVLYTNSGSENTELALKIADYVNKKAWHNRILAFKDSYHGTFFGGVSVSGIDQEINHSFYPKYGEVTFLDYPKTAQEEQDVLADLEKFAAFYDVMMIEPILASAGVYSASVDFFNRLLQILRKNKVLIVFDEVATGFFKTGSSFFFKRLSETPDILCLSKGINNGIAAFGCVCVSEELDASLQQSKRIKEHFSTQNGNLLGMASADIVLDYYLEHSNELESRVSHLSHLIRKIFDDQALAYRNEGIMTTVKIKEGYSAQVMKELEKLGLLVYLYANEEEEGISIMPPFNSDEEVLIRALKMIAKKVLKYQ
ncbi:aminotransferase class III-fold pyridoxal phosphate-dependent enzyme [Streptococcus macacae]|uniref:Aminotransferase, class III n=1 Tax=Streptococcus macacae NCTC 11558 TaxID=764298 RepID=G5JW17_9STRE|nr:aminotransferase class III-fold pyridoxal phosphate-dependent enzyme [Streptococcus macacae]EHJ51825.1 aminotransferase, class III [Streptococcus macacae NCTC 11558]SUN79350.1 aminotransferase [Streptococcus macacae NCTC 11558]